MYLKIIKTTILLLALSNVAWAQESNNMAEPIHLSSDRLDVDEAKGHSIYSGNVMFRQGTTKLWADRLTLKSEGFDALQRIVAMGKPARFEVLSDAAGDTVQGQAQSLIYIVPEEIVILEGEARLQQNDNNFSSFRIQYNNLSRKVVASKGKGNDQRVNVVIQPKPTTPEDGSK